MTSWTLALALLAAFPLVGCSAVSRKRRAPRKRTKKHTLCSKSYAKRRFDVLAATPDDTPCRAEWRRLAAEATDTLQRALRGRQQREALA